MVRWDARARVWTRAGVGAGARVGARVGVGMRYTE